MRDKIHAVINATWLMPDRWFDSAALLPAMQRADEAWKRRHSRWLREGAFWDLYLDRLLQVKGGRQPAVRQRLRDFIGPSKAEQFEDDLVRFTESLPRRYAFEFPLPAAVTVGAKEVKLSKTMAFVEVQRPAQVPLGNALAGIPASAQSTESMTALRVHAVGYFHGSYEDSAAENALAVLRQFMSLGYADGMIDADWRPYSPVYETEPEVVDLDDVSAEPKKLVLPAPMAGLLKFRRLSPAAFGERVKGTIGALMQVFAETPRPEPERAAALKENMGVVMQVLQASKRKAGHLLTGAEWLFDSHAEQNQTTALLFASIGLEAVLDAPRNEVTLRLGDRLAWLLGRNLEQRARIAKSYADFYKVRSDLVHGRERTLDANGRTKVDWGREMLRAVLAKDLEQWPTKAPKKSKKAK